MSLRGTQYGSTIYTRAEIGLRPPRSTTGIPNVEMTTDHYAGPSDWGQPGVDRSSPARFRDTTDHRRCAAIMRSHQAYHMDSKGWSDYAYNGAACPHGFGFIGRGRGVRSAANGTTAGNSLSYALQYMGAGVHNGVEDPLTEEAKRAFYDMAAYLDEEQKRGHRDWKSTSCPGENVYAWRRAGFPRPSGSTVPPPPSEEDDDMAYFRRVTAPNRGIRIVTNEGAAAGFPNSEELTEMVRDLKLAGYREEKPLRFAETDDFDRYFAHLLEASSGGVNQIETAAQKQVVLLVHSALAEAFGAQPGEIDERVREIIREELAQNTGGN